MRKALEAAQAVAPPKERSLEAQRIVESAWPPRDVVTRLVECTLDILFDKHDYDGDGWEVLHSARERSRESGLRHPPPRPRRRLPIRSGWTGWRRKPPKRGPVNSINVDVPPLVAVISYDPMWTLREAVDMAMGGEAVDVRTDKSSAAAPADHPQPETTSER